MSNATKRKKVTKKKTTKRTRKNILIPISVLVCFTFACIIAILVSNEQAKVQHVDYIPEIEKRLLEEASLQSAQISGEAVESVSISDDSFEINGNSYFYFKDSGEVGDPITELNKKIPKKLENIFTTSKNLVQQFVKEYFEPDLAAKILQEMEKVDFVVGDFSQSTTLRNSSFVYENEKIYTNPANIESLEYLPDDVLIFTLVHEWIHMVENVTHGENPYRYTKFNEAMTDVIARTIYFHNRADGNGYGEFYPYAFFFLDTFQEDALHAYFFGYDFLFETGKLTEDRMTIFCFLVEMSDSTVQADGMSHQEAYQQLTGLTLEDLQSFSKGLLTMSSN